ncbi:MAG: GatB/YqeY domain-containing protein [Acidobacteriota bacterium]
MTFIEDISAAITDAMRAKDQLRLGTLRMLKAALMNREIERGRALDDGESKQVVASLVKQRKDSMEQFSKGGREDLASKEAAELHVLESYLPPSADPAALEHAVLAAIAETGATSAKDMGRVMKAAMAKLAGQTVDGKAVNELVRQKLTGAGA